MTTALSNREMHLSPNGARLIEREEGCILHPYNDVENNATIGVGHLIHFGPVTARDVNVYRAFNRAAATKLLDEDVRGYEEDIRELIHRELNQNQWDATVDIVFNCGPGVLRSSVGTLINQGDWEAAGNAMLAWCHGDGGIIIPDLQRRRENDRQLFLTDPPPYVPANEARWIREYDQLKGKHTAWANLRRRVLQRYMRAQLLKILHAADDDGGWNKLNRAARYKALLARV